MVVVRVARTRFLAALLIGAGSTLAVSQLRRYLRILRKEQRLLADAAAPKGVSRADSVVPPAPAVDARFVHRLIDILRLCIPGVFSFEARLVLIQGLLLGARTLLSDRIAALEGICAANVTALNWPKLRYTMIAFASTAIPASIVNSGLKAMQLALRLAMRKRLTTHLHHLYMNNRAYYSASVLGGLEHAEQRLTEDVDKFCETLSELYSKTLKPMLDLVVFSRSLSRLIGYRGQAIIYAYFIIVGAFLRRISPPLAKLTAQYSSLDGAFRKAHGRLSACAEQVAFNDPPAGRAEMRSLNRRLDNMIRHSRLTAVQRFIQQCIDGFLVKYTASIIGLVVHAAPLYFNPPTNLTTHELTGQYVRSMRLMMPAAAAMGELVMCYKRILSLAGHTSRVSELMEQVRELGTPQGHVDAFRRVQKRVSGSYKSKEYGALEPNGLLRNESVTTFALAAVPTGLCGTTIKFENVSLWSPDGTMLVRGLNMEVAEGRSVIIVGPNGSGKSSILRMLGGLWPLQAGTVSMPPREEIFFLSQKPYTFSGTLAEQLMYPNLPGVVVGEKVTFNEARAREALKKVEMETLIARCDGFDGALAWDETLSGGQRGRLAVARLLYHRPKYAILDECTAAVSAEGELVLYRAMVEAKITLLSVAHRDAVKQFHQEQVVLNGDKTWQIVPIENSETKLS